MITWRPVESSSVVAIGWPKDVYAVPDALGPSLSDRLTYAERSGNWRPKLLLVRFTDGRCYGYLGVSQQRAVFMATRCKSVGRYIERVIKPEFNAVRIPSLDLDGAPF